MNDQAQKIVAFLWNGLVKLWDGAQATVLQLYVFLDQGLLVYHSQVAVGVVALVIVAILGGIRNLIWPRKLAPAQPERPPKYIRRPQAYRLLICVSVLIAIYLFACFQASSM
jgi:hypothetical protein